MNQKFKKHLDDSYTRAFEECSRAGHKIGNLDMIFNSIVMRTFAELIVRECIEIVGDCSIEYATRPQIMKEIKEHFGVE